MEKTKLQVMLDLAESGLYMAPGTREEIKNAQESPNKIDTTYDTVMSSLSLGFHRQLNKKNESFVDLLLLVNYFLDHYNLVGKETLKIILTPETYNEIIADFSLSIDEKIRLLLIRNFIHHNKANDFLYELLSIEPSQLEIRKTSENRIESSDYLDLIFILKTNNMEIHANFVTDCFADIEFSGENTEPELNRIKHNSLLTIMGQVLDSEALSLENELIIIRILKTMLGESIALELVRSYGLKEYYMEKYPVSRREHALQIASLKMDKENNETLDGFLMRILSLEPIQHME